jgi:hypothetical protein
MASVPALFLYHHTYAPRTAALIRFLLMYLNRLWVVERCCCGSLVSVLQTYVCACRLCVVRALVLQLSKGLKRRVEKTKQKLAGSAADEEFDQHKENFEDQQHDAKRLFKEAERQVVFAAQHCWRLCSQHCCSTQCGVSCSAVFAPQLFAFAQHCLRLHNIVAQLSLGVSCSAVFAPQHCCACTTLLLNSVSSSVRFCGVWAVSFC